MDDLLGEFVAETREMLAALGGEIVAWEADPADRARLDTIFRFVHTVKGNCGFFDFPQLAALSHAAEDALGDVRAGRRAADRALVDGVLAVIDRIAVMIARIEQAEPLDCGNDADLIAALAGPREGGANAAAAPGAAPAPPPARQPDQRTIRLPVELLDQVMSGVSEMVLARNDLVRRLEQIRTDAAFDASFARLSGLITEVRDAITRTRMRPIEGLFGTFPRLVRDLSAGLGKRVAIELEHGEVELDREMIELIRDPLLHLIRNAVDHGIEAPAQRLAAGKPEVGLLTISARQTGNTIHIVIQDDGRGIDCERVRARALAAGLRDADELATLCRDDLIELIFEPGLSTADRVTEISGRGVGMDVVRANIEKFGGTLEIDSTTGQGTCFLIRVPLTLSILPSLTVEAGGQTFAIPRSYVEEIVSTAEGGSTVTRIGERPYLTVHGRRVAGVSLARELGLVPAAGEGQAAAGGAVGELAPLHVILRLGWGELYALGIDRICDHQELVIKPLAPVIMASGLFVGCTQLDDGTPVLVLDVSAIGHRAGIPRALHRPAAAQPRAPEQRDEALRVVLLRALGGERQAIVLSAVEHVERVSAGSVRRPGPHAQVVVGNQILPLAGVPADLPLPEQIAVLRLAEGEHRLAYAAQDVLDIAALEGELVAPGTDAGAVAAVTLVGGEAVELIDFRRLWPAQSGQELTV